MPRISKFKNRKPRSPRGARASEPPSFTMTSIPESNEVEIRREKTPQKRAGRVRFPKEKIDKLKMMPDEFKRAQNATEDYEREKRERAVFGDSIESFVGYNSLVRILSQIYSSRVSFYRSSEGGNLSREEARERAYRRDVTIEEGTEMLRDLMAKPTSRIDYHELLDLHGYYPAAAENIWELMKREAKSEFESGHRAAGALEPEKFLQSAWNRASYLGLRESLCEEWQPKGGIELTMIDSIAQAWLQLQFWMKESVKRAQTTPRMENPQYVEWRDLHRKPHEKQWQAGYWDLPLVSDQNAIEHASQMVERWQRMYLRAIRSLRDWRRYTPTLTINNANQVNIATDGGQQVNVTNGKEENEKKITS